LPEEAVHSQGGQPPSGPGPQAAEVTQVQRAPCCMSGRLSA